MLKTSVFIDLLLFIYIFEQVVIV